MDEEVLQKYLEENLRIEISRDAEPDLDYRNLTVRVNLILKNKVICTSYYCEG